MEPTINYMLEFLTVNTVNVIIIKTLELNGKIYELERNRICYSNSPIGRNMVVEKCQNESKRSKFLITFPKPKITPECFYAILYRKRGL